MNNDLKNLLKVIRNNDKKCVKHMYIKTSNNEYKIYNDLTTTIIDEILNNNYEVLSIIFKTGKSWLCQYTIRQLELLNSNNELNNLDINRTEKDVIILFEFVSIYLK